MENHIEQLQNKFKSTEELFIKFELWPEFVTSQELISLGIFRSFNSLAKARERKTSPPYVIIGKKAFYPKQLLIEYIRERLKL